MEMTILPRMYNIIFAFLTMVLDEDMFEGIPDSAFCSLYVLRGDVEMLNSDGVSLNVVAETHDSLNFVLIRNVVENEE